MEKPDIIFIPSWLAQATADEALRELKDLPWKSEAISLFGRDIVVPRKVLYYADNNTNYRYAGINHIGQRFPAVIQQLRDQLANQHNLYFDACLANHLSKW